MKASLSCGSCAMSRALVYPTSCSQGEFEEPGFFPVSHVTWNENPDRVTGTPQCSALSSPECWAGGLHSAACWD